MNERVTNMRHSAYIYARQSATTRYVKFILAYLSKSASFYYFILLWRNSLYNMDILLIHKITHFHLTND